MDCTIEKGRKLVLGIVITMLALSFLSIVIYISSLGVGKLGTQIIRFFLTCLLCFFLYNGHGWAKWLTVVLMGIASIMGLFGTLAIFINPLLGAASFLYFTLYGTTVVLLIASKSINEYFQYQKG